MTNDYRQNSEAHAGAQRGDATIGLGFLTERKAAGVLLVVALLFGCEFPTMTGEFDEQFGKQNFNSAVALIELHKTRTGHYPSSLDDLMFLADWDAISLSAVTYERTETGYNLTVHRGWVGEPELVYPEGFRVGLGLEESNIVWE